VSAQLCTMQLTTREMLPALVTASSGIALAHQCSYASFSRASGAGGAASKRLAYCRHACLTAVFCPSVLFQLNCSCVLLLPGVCHRSVWCWISTQQYLCFAAAQDVFTQLCTMQLTTCDVLPALVTASSGIALAHHIKGWSCCSAVCATLCICC
jgi:hypothetical protein